MKYVIMKLFAFTVYTIVGLTLGYLSAVPIAFLLGSGLIQSFVLFVVLSIAWFVIVTTYVEFL